jgi:hypothetical protein
MYASVLLLSQFIGRCPLRCGMELTLCFIQILTINPLAIRGLHTRKSFFTYMIVPVFTLFQFVMFTYYEKNVMHDIELILIKVCMHLDFVLRFFNGKMRYVCPFRVRMRWFDSINVYALTAFRDCCTIKQCNIHCINYANSCFN